MPQYCDLMLADLSVMLLVKILNRNLVVVDRQLNAGFFLLNTPPAVPQVSRPIQFVSYCLF